MIKSFYDGSKTVTANQYAKQLIMDAIDARECDLNLGDFSVKEQDAISEAFDKQTSRIYNVLGMAKINS